MDFQFDETSNGKQLKLLNIQDIFTRECLAVKTERSITADDVTTCSISWSPNMACRPTCAGQRSRVRGLRHCRLVSLQRLRTTFIDPGSPWQNGHIESFNSRLRDEFLNGHLSSHFEAQVLLEDWRHEYNHEPLHSSLCYLTPVEFEGCGPAKQERL